ncbi:MAG: Ig-like domain-containing protein, partial [Candidatus Marinimicrobia bacterium]|nr:Ig-like domain-containing protein [Candidatus Neomarinimicrobiota bacterium]
MIGYSLLVDSTRITESLNSINFYFNQEVYGGTYSNIYSGNGIGLEISDFEITIQSNGGNTTGAEFTSITNLLGNPLLGGEEAIRLNIGFNELPSGSEVAIIKPASLSSIFNLIGVPLLDTTGIEIYLVDQLPPSASFNPDIGEAILPTQEFTITASEPIRLLNDSAITNTDLNNMVSIAYTDGDEETIPFSASIDNNIITIIPTSALTEMRELRITLLDSLEDLANNQIDTYTANYTVQDVSPPIINTQSSSISTSNVFIILSFSESVYTNNDGTGSLELSDLSLDFSDNGGNATDVTMVDLQRPGPSGPLLGGEDSIWVYLTVDGTPSGEETFTITTNGNEAIFDGFGNPLAFPNNSTSEITLNPYPRLTGNSLENNNVYVELQFSEGVYSASDTSSGVEVTDFDISFNQNNGNANDAIISSLTKTNGSPLSGNESTIRAILNISSPPPNGLETIQITPANAYAICNSLGNRLSVAECTINLTLIDRLVPTINDINIIADSIVAITSSEEMYNNVGATGAINTNHLQATVYANDGNASEATIVNITNDNQGPLLGGEIIVRIGFVTDLLPSGVEEMTISPVGPANPIYDSSNNQMPQTTISAKVFLPDRLPPIIISETAVIAVDNSYVEFSLTEGVYGTYEVTNPVEPNDFEIVFIQNNGNASSASVDFITNEDQFPVVGGEKILRCYLSFNAAPSGHEQLYIRAINGNSVFDLAGNSLRAEQVTDTLQLSDQLVPTVSSISIPHGSSISSSTDQPINITFSEPIQSFNYSISARHYNSLSWDTTESLNANQFQLTLNKPMASLDTITITISSLTDSAGLEAVDFSYEFYTPALGDYDTSGRVDIEDLTRFVTFWLADSEAIFNGLGPTTGQLPHFVPHLDHQYDLDDGMTFIRMWS